MFESEWQRRESEAREDESNPLQVFTELELDRYDDSIVEPLIRRLEDDDVRIGMFDVATAAVIHTELRAPSENGRFTKLDVLYAALVAQHELSPVNDRIFEGIAREEDGSYSMATGS